MIKRTLLRRLEMLEEQTIPEGEPMVMTINFVDGETKQVTSQLQVTLGACLPMRHHRTSGRNSYRCSENCCPHAEMKRVFAS
jgi:hypothetical protein